MCQPCVAAFTATVFWSTHQLGGVGAPKGLCEDLRACVWWTQGWNPVLCDCKATHCPVLPRQLPLHRGVPAPTGGSAASLWTPGKARAGAAGETVTRIWSENSETEIEVSEFEEGNGEDHGLPVRLLPRDAGQSP